MWGRKKKTTPDTLAGIKVGRLHSDVDVNHFDLGILVDEARGQATVQFAVEDHTVVAEDQWRQWEALAGQMPRVMALFTTDVAGGATPHQPRAGAVFYADKKADRKDVDGFIADLLVHAAPMFSYADEVGLVSTPLDADAVRAALAHGLHCAEATSWEELTTQEYEETDATLTLDPEGVAAQASVFTTPADHEGLTSEIDDILHEWEGDVRLRRSRFFRPFVVADSDEEDELAGGGRRHCLVTVEGGADGASAFVDALTPASQVSLRRAWCRQRSLFIAGLGTGVLGFQRAVTDFKRPQPFAA